MDNKLPCPLRDDPTFVYVPAVATDITKTWRKFGWLPMREQETQNEHQRTS